MCRKLLNQMYAKQDEKMKQAERAVHPIENPVEESGRIAAAIPPNPWLVNYCREPFNPPKTPDNVNHPKHYTQGSIEVIDFIEDHDFSHHVACVVKYVCRYPFKNGLEDLKKAENYLRRKVAIALKASRGSIHIHYYIEGSINVWDFIEDQKLGYHAGNVIELMVKHRNENIVKYLIKAQWHLNRLIELETNETKS